jgi:hypothetical protein
MPPLPHLIMAGFKLFFRDTEGFYRHRSRALSLALSRGCSESLRLFLPASLLSRSPQGQAFPRVFA